MTTEYTEYTVSISINRFDHENGLARQISQDMTTVAAFRELKDAEDLAYRLDICANNEFNKGKWESVIDE